MREALEVSAALRLPASVTASARAAFVLELLSLLELVPLAESKVGEPGSTDGLAPGWQMFGALSPAQSSTVATAVGERKRLTIGVELCANAPVLFLDEPTSGTCYS